MEITEEHSSVAQDHGWRRTDWFWLGFLLCLAALIWCGAYNRWTYRSWSTPISYSGDSWSTLAATKALAAGDIPPVLPKNPPTLGAPFHANWNDYPSVEEGILVWTGLLARLFGTFTGANLAVLSAHLLAAASFYFVARQMRYHPLFSFVGAILFSFSRFAFARSLHHLTLTFYWHVPLGILVIWYCLTRASIHKDRRLMLFCAVVAVLFGIQNIYFTGIFLQFLAGVALYLAVVRRPWPQIAFPLGLAALVVFTFCVMNIDTLSYRMTSGPNPAVLERNFAGVELYALKPIELIVPIAHRITAIETWGVTRYASQAFVVGEMGSPYLGLVGIVAFLWLAGQTAWHLARRNLQSVSWYVWPLLWIFAYSVIGGINSLLGVFGVVLFRCTNRYSIVILALVLLFLVRNLASLARRWSWQSRIALAGSILAIGLPDQIPAEPRSWQIAEIRKVLRADAQMVARLESKLPRKAMIFQMPVMDYPEVPPLRGVEDYEHFRPYLHSRHLRFSYGSNKGRNRERWQREAEGLGGARLIGLLEQYGFAAILINRKGYEDGAAALLAELGALGKTDLLFQGPHFFCVALKPVARPILPPEFDGNWHDLEWAEGHDWRWSSGNTSFVLYNPEPAPRSVRLSFALQTLIPRRLEISMNARTLYSSALEPPEPTNPLEIDLVLAAGRNELRFHTSVPGAPPGGEDKRKLAFAIRDFQVRE